MTSVNMKSKESKMNSVEKALRILLAFQADNSTWGVRDLSALLGFSPATVQRLLQTLKAYDFVRQDSETRKYRLGSVYFQFLQTTYPVVRAIIPYLEKLLSRTRETVHFNIIEEMDRVCVNSLESQQTLKASMPIGEHSPLYAGASSKCLLAFSPLDFVEKFLSTASFQQITESTIINATQLREELDAIKSQGYAASSGERTPGLGSLSAPVFNFNGRLQGCISLAIPELRFKDYDHRKFCIEALLSIAKEASRDLRFAQK